MEKQPIETAPKDGTPVLTNEGICLFVQQKNWGSPMPNNVWLACDTYGELFRCADNGYFHCSPKFWAPLPDWADPDSYTRNEKQDG